MVQPKPPSQDELIARILAPGSLYASVKQSLYDNQGAGEAIKAVAAVALDELDIEVEIRSDEYDVSYDADITSSSRRAANNAIGAMAENVDASLAELHAGAKESLIEDLERNLVCIPPSWRDIAMKHGVVSSWLDLAAQLKAVPEVMRWSGGQETPWVEWFAGAMGEDFFTKRERVEQVLRGMDVLLAKGKPKEQNLKVSAIWAEVLLQSPVVATHLNTIGVREYLDGKPSPALKMLAQKGWAVDPSTAAWPEVIDYQDVEGPRFGAVMGDFLLTHMNAIIKNWPEMARLPTEGMPTDTDQARKGPFKGISLWHLVASIEPDKRGILGEMLQAHSMSLDTPMVRRKAPNPRF